LRAVEWRDLRRFERCEVAYESLLALPWLAASLGAWQLAFSGHPAFVALALPAAFFFFLTGLRQVHNAYHYTLGLGRPATELTMFALSVAMMSAMHAIQATHLHHHRHCLDEDDVEGSVARGSWRRAVLAGPAFAVRLQREDWRLAGPRARRWIAIELSAIAATAAVAVGVDLPALGAHVATMIAGQCLTGFFAVWTVHRGCAAGGWIARTQRGWLKNLVSYDMFHHAEHHLFPGVPTVHLPELARRLDRAASEYRAWQVY
jgi:fatty acid desaturase